MRVVVEKNLTVHFPMIYLGHKTEKEKHYDKDK